MAPGNWREEKRMLTEGGETESPNYWCATETLSSPKGKRGSGLALQEMLEGVLQAKGK